MSFLSRSTSSGFGKALILGVLVGVTALPEMTFAALPQAQAPTRGEGSSWMQTFQNYAYDGFTFLGLVLCAYALIMVGRHALGVYHEIHMGKAKWADLGATAVVGVSLIGVTIFLVTKATSVL
ncbi:TIGR03745 family integrating conjugative element membrane protein [Pseudomonas sp. NPDC088368]|uniref:TIGR03745 family integrating conjugative element membrane protein n=1 Tax=Pseudomonas sp. NPDC088368 TaxID=3364453 RepID=UPI00382FA2A3